MRKSTMLVTTLVAASTLAISWRVGDLLAPEPIDLANLSSSSAPSAEPQPTESSTPNPTESSSTPTPTSTPGSSAKPTPAKTVAPVKPKAVTVSSDPITYKYGVVQVEITKLGQEITDVQMLQGDATNGRAQAYTILMDATLKTQGLNFGNVSGATFTTDAFKKAVTNALKKF